ncbi:MAG: alpha/beta fold hydrolase [Galactobacter sp.]
MLTSSASTLDPPLADDREALAFHVEIGGARVRTWLYPSRGVQRGIVLAVHGFRGDHHGLRRLVNALPDYTVVAPDLPGFGASDPFSDAAYTHSAPGYVPVVVGLARALDLPPSTVLLGHSFGSVVAAYTVAEHPGLFGQLVLVNPICRPALQTSASQAVSTAVVAGYYELSALLPRRVGESVLRARLVVDVTTAAMLTSKAPLVKDYVRDQHRTYFAAFSDPETLLSAYRSSITHSVRDVASRITTPTLLVAGEKDPLGSVRGQQRLADTIGNAQLDVIPGVGHLIHYETPAAAAAFIEDFLSQR